MTCLSQRDASISLRGPVTSVCPERLVHSSLGGVLPARPGGHHSPAGWTGSCRVFSHREASSTHPRGGGARSQVDPWLRSIISESRQFIGQSPPPWLHPLGFWVTSVQRLLLSGRRLPVPEGSSSGVISARLPGIRQPTLRRLRTRRRVAVEWRSGGDLLVLNRLGYPHASG